MKNLKLKSARAALDLSQQQLAEEGIPLHQTDSCIGDPSARLIEPRFIDHLSASRCQTALIAPRFLCSHAPNKRQFISLSLTVLSRFRSPKNDTAKSDGNLTAYAQI